MKLLIKRDQKSGMFTGKAKFFLYVRAEVTPEEQDLIKKCGLENELLVHHEKEHDSLVGSVMDATRGGGLVRSIMKGISDTELTTKSLINGTEFDCNDVAELIAIENQVIGAGMNLKNYIETAKSFGGEKIIDIDELLEVEDTASA